MPQNTSSERRYCEYNNEHIEENRKSQNILDLPSFQACEEKREVSRLTSEERILAFVDVFGTVPPSELSLEAFDREMTYLPVEQKSAMHRGYTVEQARQFLLLEDNDPKRAAVRMANYWETRHRVFGEDAFLAENKTARTEDDFRRIYGTAMKALIDPKVDTETKIWAQHYLSEWNTMHILRLDEELEKIRSEDKLEFLEAQRKRPDLTLSDEAKLRFLHTEDFEAQRAARRMVRYWKFRFNLWGRDRALDQITLEELEEHYSNEISMGWLCFTQKSDVAGRCILGVFPRTLKKPHDEDGLLKVIWGILHAAMADVSWRTNFVIIDVLTDLNAASITMRFAKNLCEIMFHCCPVKIVAVHDCAPPAPSWFVRIVAPVFKMLIGRKMRMRYCIHSGTDEEIQAELAILGIRKDLLPIELGGELDYESLGKLWLEKKREAGF